MVRGERQDDLSRTGDDLATSLLVLDGTEQTEKVDEHDAVRKLGLVVQAIDLTPVLRDSGEG